MDRLLTNVLGFGLTVGMVLAPAVPASSASQKAAPSTGQKMQQRPPSAAVPMTTDIAITGLTADAGTCRIWVTWTNKGTTKINAVLKERVEIHAQPSQKVESMNQVVLEAGASFSHGVGANPGLTISGVQEVLAWIDVDSVLRESDEANNSVTRTLTCGQGRAQPDLIPSTITFVVKSTTIDTQGHTCKVLKLKPVIKNIGTAGASKTFTVKLEADTGLGQSSVAYHDYLVPGLAEGATLALADFEVDTCLWFVKNPQLPANSVRRFRLTVDSRKDVTESREDNNDTIAIY
jgi:hypothetical protein